MMVNGQAPLNRSLEYRADHLGTLGSSELAQLNAATHILEKLLCDWR
ncbi:MAG: hypothetical protein WA239_29615 [Candidatus Sulfotelmatobacter sp.]